MARRKKEQTYGQSSWEVGDVLDRYDVTAEEAREFLARIDGDLAEAAVEAGWQVMEELAPSTWEQIDGEDMVDLFGL